jgi:hypothetical protein
MLRGSERGPQAARVFMALALVLGLTRFWRLGEWGLWVDEAHTLHDAMWLLPGSPPDYPLGYLAVRAVIELCGGATGEAVLRFFPALCGFLSIPMCAWALQPALGPTRSSATALLLSVSSWHLFWSQNARSYTLALVLSLIGAGLWLRGVLQPDRRALAGGLAAGAAAAFAHPSAALLLPAWLLAPVLVGPLGARLKQRPPALLLVGTALLGALVMGGWMAAVWNTYENVKGGTSFMHFVSTTGWYMTPGFLLGALLGAWMAWRARQAEELLLAIVVALVFLGATVASMFVKVAAQYIFVLLPWVAALATLPLARIRRPALRTAWMLLLCLPPLADTVLYFTVRHGDRPRWKEAFALVFEERGPEDLVFGMHAPVGEYYLNPGATWLRSQRRLLRLDESLLGEAEPWLRRGRKLWVVLAPEDLGDWSREARASLLELLAEEGHKEAEFPVPWTPRHMLVEVWVLG